MFYSTNECIISNCLFSPCISIAENGDSRPVDGVNSKLPPLPISNATKKSFQTDLASNLMKGDLRNAASNPELDKIGASPQL